jgi:hypothetical protein
MAGRLGMWQQGSGASVAGVLNLAPLLAAVRDLRDTLGRPNVSIVENFPVHTDPASDRLKDSVTKGAGL